MTDLIGEFGLTPKQAALVGAYFKNKMNKRAAADEVGCSVGMFNAYEVQNAIMSMSRSVVEDAHLQGVAIVEELSKIALVRKNDFFDIVDGRPKLKENIDPEMWGAVAEFKTDDNGFIVDMKFHSKSAAIEQLAKFMQWWKNENETHNIINIGVDNTKDAEVIDNADLQRRATFLMEYLNRSKEDGNQTDRVSECSIDGGG